MNFKEVTSKGVRGFILQDFLGKYWFRVYEKDYKFTDYELNIEELEVELIGDFASLYYYDNGETKIGWSQKVLKGRLPDNICGQTPDNESGTYCGWPVGDLPDITPLKFVNDESKEEFQKGM